MNSLIAPGLSVGLLLRAVLVVLGLDEQVPPQQHAVDPAHLVDQIAQPVGDQDRDIEHAVPGDDGPVVGDRVLKELPHVVDSREQLAQVRHQPLPVTLDDADRGRPELALRQPPRLQRVLGKLTASFEIHRYRAMLVPDRLGGSSRRDGHWLRPLSPKIPET
jgi:hypothetical protein